MAIFNNLIEFPKIVASSNELVKKIGGLKIPRAGRRKRRMSERERERIGIVCGIFCLVRGKENLERKKE